MPGLAVITAPNPRNYGMYSVDLAAEELFAARGEPFTLLTTQCRTRVGRLRLELLRDPGALARYDTVVYWGDFLNNPMWGADDWAGREWRRYGAATRAEGFARWRALHLELRRHHPALRVLAVGGCFLGADRVEAPDVRRALAEFLEGAELVAPRDRRSLEIVRALAPRARAVEGVDCAWLLPRAAQPARAAGGHFVWFLGRTLRRTRRRWIGELSRRTGLRAIGIDWLNQRRPRFLSDWNYERMARLVAGAEFVVTDTYHLVINALLRGVRAVCLYDSAQDEGATSVGDAKKGLLLREVGAPELLVDVRSAGPLAAAVHERLERFGSADLDRALDRFQVRRDGFRRVIERALDAGAAAAGGRASGVG